MTAKGFGPYANAKVPDRKYLWTVVGLFTLLGLAGLGALLYRPLRLQYAVYKVRHTTWEQWRRDFDQGKDAAYERYLKECVEAACRGNRPAMEAVIDASGFGDGYIAETTSEIAYQVAASQPDAFFRALDRRKAGRVREVLSDIADSCASKSEAEYGPGAEDPSPKSLAKAFKAYSEAKAPEVRLVAAATLDFIRHRFSKELAEAEGRNAKEPAR